VVGAALGVEEFVLLALVALALGGCGAVSARLRARRVRRSLTVEVEVSVPETFVGDVVLARVVLSTRDGALAPLRVDDPAGRWVLSHPGLGGRPVAATGTRRAGPVGRPPSRTSTVGLGGVRPDRPAVLAVPVPTQRRGVRSLEGLRVWCDDLFGLFMVPAGTVPAARLLVCPAPAPAPTPAPAPESARPEAARRRGGSRPLVTAAGAVGRQAGDELDRLRPYVPGDRLARLHWQALARTGDLVVREFSAAGGGRIALLVDVRPGADEALFDAAMEAAAGIGTAALSAGTAVELCTSAGERLDIAPGASGVGTLLRALALLGPAVSRRGAALRRGADAPSDALWATDNQADAGQVLVTTRPGDRVLPQALSRRTSVVVVR